MTTSASPFYRRVLSLATLLCSLTTSGQLAAEIQRVEISSRETLTEPGRDFSYERIEGVAYFTLDPGNPLDQVVIDLQYAPRNAQGLVEYAADFRLLVPSRNIASDVLLYNVNNRGNSRVPPEQSLAHPLAERGYTYLTTGWINEISAGNDRLRLHAPVVSDSGRSITGPARYEVIVGSETDRVNVGGSNHLGYAPAREGAPAATLTRRSYQQEPRVPIERSRFDILVTGQADSSQPLIELLLEGGFEPGVIYELIYDAKDPVLAGAGLASIRDMVAAIREGTAPSELQGVLPVIDHTVAWGISQSGRLLRQFMYDGFNQSLSGQPVFDGVIPVIAGGGYGMFNLRFAMPTRTNGQHSNHLYPNDLFPFTYGDSVDPVSGRRDGVLRPSREAGVEPKLMHIQTSNEYWVRAGSLPHTTADGSADAEIPENVRFYTIGGSQHGSGSGIPREASSGQLPPNPNRWTPLFESLMVAMVDWVSTGTEPPPSRYPRIADGSLVPSHVNGRINRRAWNSLRGINHPTASYQPQRANYGPRREDERIIDSYPQQGESVYQALVPAVNADNNDLPTATILPPLTAVPLATFVPWNLRAEETGAELALARLAGGYIPLPASTAAAVQNRDPRTSIAALYRDFADYRAQYEAAVDGLIEAGYLLSGFKPSYMDITEQYRSLFP